MSPGVAFALFAVSAAMILGALVLLWSIGSSLRGRNDRRHEVTDPAGLIWSTRLHWGHPGAGIGVARRLFPASPSVPSQEADSEPADSPDPAEPEQADAKRPGRWTDWLDGLDIFDEGFLIVLGLIVMFGVLVAGVIVVLLAIELILVLLLAAVLAVVRSLFGHPWVIETTDPDGFSTFDSIRRLRTAVATHRRLRRSIETGMDTGSFEV